MNKSVFGIVVTFHPDVSFLENAKEILKQVSQLIIVDNDSNSMSNALLNSLQNDPKVYLIRNEKNEGIAKALNQGIELALNSGANYLLFLDQDSCPFPKMVQSLYEAVVARNEPAIAGPILVDRTSGKKDGVVLSETPVEVELLITSGSFLAKEVVLKVGVMDESLFIDYVDHDFCLRLKNIGGVLLRAPNAEMYHSFGEAISKSILGRKFFVQNYSPFRRYYMARNRTIIYRRYAKWSQKWFRHDLLFSCKDLFKLVFFENGKLAKIDAVFRGTVDGIKFKRKR